MPQKKKYVYGKGMPLYFLSIVFAVISVLLQALTVLFCYDPSMKVYKHGSALGPVSGVIIFIFVLAFSVMSIYVMGNLRKLKSLPPTSAVNAFISSSAGAFAFLSSVLMWIQSRGMGGNVSTVSAAMMVLSVPAAAYFILSSLKSTRQSLLYGFGFFPVLWSASCLLRVYFDTGVAINDPVRVLFQVSFAAIMLTLLFELRTRLGKKGMPVYVALSGVSVILGLPAAVSMLILFAIPKTVRAAERLLCITQLLLCFHILTRLHTNHKYV